MLIFDRMDSYHVSCVARCNFLYVRLHIDLQIDAEWNTVNTNTSWTRNVKNDWYSSTFGRAIPNSSTCAKLTYTLHWLHRDGVDVNPLLNSWWDSKQADTPKHKVMPYFQVLVTGPPVSPPSDTFRSDWSFLLLILTSIHCETHWNMTLLLVMWLLLLQQVGSSWYKMMHFWWLIQSSKFDSPLNSTMYMNL